MQGDQLMAPCGWHAAKRKQRRSFSCQCNLVFELPALHPSPAAASPATPAPPPCSRHCRALQCLHLELQPPQVSLTAAAEAEARAAAGEPWGAAPGVDGMCPPVDGFLLKLLAQVSCVCVCVAMALCLWVMCHCITASCPNPSVLASADAAPPLLSNQCCPGLRSVRLVNVTNNATINRLVS